MRSEPAHGPGEDLREVVNRLEREFFDDGADRAGLVGQCAERLREARQPGLTEAARELSTLHARLADPELQPEALGRLLAAAGERALAAAPLAPDDGVGRVIERLGHFLFHAGHAMIGPRPVSSRPSSS